jgi:hypothetical protein
MRLPPLSKVWRAFPELDRFSDAQCKAYVRLARRERPGVLVVSAALCSGASFSLSSLSWAPFFFGGSFGGDWRRFNLAGPLGDNWMLVIVLSILVSIGGPLVVFFLVRDKWLRRAVRLHLRGAHCLM